MERKTQTGYLLLADISGYTSFVAQTEIEHADMALSFLLVRPAPRSLHCQTGSGLRHQPPGRSSSALRPGDSETGIAAPGGETGSEKSSHPCDVSWDVRQDPNR